MNLRKGVGGWDGPGGSHQSRAQILIEQARQQAFFRGQAMNQHLIDELRLKIELTQKRINMAMLFQPGSGYNISQLYREEANLQQELYKHVFMSQHFAINGDNIRMCT